MSVTDVCEGPVNVSDLYATVNIENKSKKNSLKRVSNKYELFIPNISDSRPELSNSDSNLYATLLSVEEIQDSLSCSRTLFGSADDIITEQSFSDSDQTEITIGSRLMSHDTSPIRKIPPPPPAKPPPYQKGEPDFPQKGEPDFPQNSNVARFRRSKSTNSKHGLRPDNRFPLKSEIGDLKKSNKKLGIQSFRRNKETPEKSTSGLLVSTSTPLKANTKTTVPVQIPFKKSPLTPLPQDIILPQKLSPPQANKLTNKLSPPENKNKTTSPPVPLPSQNILRPPPPLPTNPKPTLTTRPPLRPPIHPKPDNITQLASLPSMNSRPSPPLSPTTSKIIKHPTRLPPPPPSYSLTLPRNLDKPSSPRQTHPIGDYTLLTPLSPESTSPTFSPLSTNESNSPPDELGPIISDEGYSVLNIQDCDDIVKDNSVKKFTRANSLPPTNSITPNSNDVTTSQTQQEMLPPKKPPRRMTSTNLSPTDLYSPSEYTVLSSVDSDVGLFIEQQNIMLSNDYEVVPSIDVKPDDSVINQKTMTIASHGTRPVPPKPAAYRPRSKSHNVDNKLSIKSVPVDYTKSVEVATDSKPVKQQAETTPEGLLHRMSKKLKSKSRGEIIIPSISTPILDTSSHKIIGLNTLLVSECVAYLKQPRSLREEGLFRIPGDLNQVNMYLKQFDYSLKPNLEDELDPNNVSGLLKMHIRNSMGLLPKKEAGDMYTAVRQKNIEDISSVIKTTSAAQQSILKEVLFLFKEVAEHESENRMSCGAIATSCGLSIFPVVNAGNANLMLKVLIDNVEEIYQQ